MSPALRAPACHDCAPSRFTLPISMAFQPIVDVGSGGVLAYEALVRGARGEGAGSVLAQVTDETRYAFDQEARTRAIGLAALLDLPAREGLLSINFFANAVYRPETCIRRTLIAARRHRFPLGSLMFELSESEAARDLDHMVRILAAYRGMGFKTAIDDFGAGHSGLTLLARFQPDFVKIDMALVRHIDTDRAKAAIVRAIARMCADLGIVPIAEGIETAEESRALAEIGIGAQQGYLFARPGFECLPEAVLPAAASEVAAVA